MKSGIAWDNFKLAVIVGCWMFGTAFIPARADELKLNAEALFEHGPTQHLNLTPDGKSLQLQRGVVIEDDGPAAGFSYQPNVEKLKDGVSIRKTLLVPAPQARQATLLVGRGGELTAQINGKSVPLKLDGKQGNYWQAWQFPSDVLQPGANDFVLSGTGSIWIARDDDYAAGSLTRTSHPNRSAKSTDGGKTWSDTRLGTANDIDGEYYVRLFLDQFQQQGTLTLGVVDVGNLAGRAIGPPLTSTGPVRIAVDAVKSTDHQLQIRTRTGTTFVPQQETWTDWSTINGSDGGVKQPRGRYLQIELSLSTKAPLSSPTIQGLTISASPERPTDWSANLQIDKFDNPTIVRSSIPFQYEPFGRPELAALRRQYKLEDVTAGAETEFELIKQLAGWSSGLWQRMHLSKSYPPYRSLEILKTHEDGTPVGGFCQQYNIVFLQACESFGLVGRLVSIGPGNMTDRIRSGHETVEIWSNEFHKWIYIDGNTAWYAVDKKSRIPLSLRELRERQLAALRDDDYPAVDIITIAKTKYEWPDLKHWPAFVELRLIPRSNFLQQRAPLPLNQGMRGWFWTGHSTWSDELIPDRLLYPNRTVRVGNFEWTLNQAHLVLEATQTAGRVRVHIDTNTPRFDAFEISRDGKLAGRSDNVLLWDLHAGRNELRVTPRNTAGRHGITSAITLNRD